MTQRTAHWGTCDDCDASVVVYPHPERETDIPSRDNWRDLYSDCYVCEGEISWGGSDPVHDIIRGYPIRKEES